jgi:hypothetical protein
VAGIPLTGEAGKSRAKIQTGIQVPVIAGRVSGVAARN